MLRRRQPVLITSAAIPRQEEIRRREQRYILTMGFRALCFVLAVVALDGWLRLVAVVLAVVLPWIAVVVANGGPAPSRRRAAGFAEQVAENAGPAALDPGRHVIVDGETVTAEAAAEQSAGDPAAGDPAAGDPMPGDPMPGDPMPGDPMPGDTVDRDAAEAAPAVRGRR